MSALAAGPRLYRGTCGLSDRLLTSLPNPAGTHADSSSESDSVRRCALSGVPPIAAALAACVSAAVRCCTTGGERHAARMYAAVLPDSVTPVPASGDACSGGELPESGDVPRRGGVAAGAALVALLPARGAALLGEGDGLPCCTALLDTPLPAGCQPESCESARKGISVSKMAFGQQMSSLKGRSAQCLAGHCTRH